MTNTTITLISPNVTSELYNITVTCTIHPDSAADECVVMAKADDGRVTRTGNYIHICICMYIYIHYIAKYVAKMMIAYMYF